jgi:hypothetical protein
LSFGCYRYRLNQESKVEKGIYAAGYRLAEKLTREGPKFKDELDLLKFICKGQLAIPATFVLLLGSSRDTPVFT